jgi:hypothetical protein
LFARWWRAELQKFQMLLREHAVLEIDAIEM